MGSAKRPSRTGQVSGFAVAAMGNPTPYDQLPTVSIVAPNEQHDADRSSVAAADAWLRKNIKHYADWARTHNSLLVVTWDEDGSTDASHGTRPLWGARAVQIQFS